jgi:hypothetical protein
VSLLQGLLNRLFSRHTPDARLSSGLVDDGLFDCLICRRWLPGSQIEVTTLPIEGLEEYYPSTRFNLRHCTRATCAAEADRRRAAAFTLKSVED